jgi:hypothetical protein
LSIIHENGRLLTDLPHKPVFISVILSDNCQWNNKFSNQLESALERTVDPYLWLLERYGQKKIIQRDKFKDGGTSTLRKNDF